MAEILNVSLDYTYHNKRIKKTCMAKFWKGNILN